MVQNHKHSGLGFDGEKISYNDLKDKPTSLVKTQSFTRDSSVGTGNQSFSGFGFTPKIIVIKSAPTSAMSDVAISDVTYEDGVVSGWSIQSGVSGDRTSNMVYILDPLNSTRATFVSIDTDGFTLNFTNSDESILMTVTCFG